MKRRYFFVTSVISLKSYKKSNLQNSEYTKIRVLFIGHQFFNLLIFSKIKLEIPTGVLDMFKESGEYNH